MERHVYSDKSTNTHYYNPMIRINDTTGYINKFERLNNDDSTHTDGDTKVLDTATVIWEDGSTTTAYDLVLVSVNKMGYERLV